MGLKSAPLRRATRKRLRASRNAGLSARLTGRLHAFAMAPRPSIEVFDRVPSIRRAMADDNYKGPCGERDRSVRGRSQRAQFVECVGR